VGDPRTHRPQNDARLETAAVKPMFRDSFSDRHCLVITDGFYEWHTDPKTGRKQPYRFVMKCGEPFAMAGIYARSDGPPTFHRVAAIACRVVQRGSPACDRGSVA
jgi:putative SOS response-associated peptidase YedK